MDALITKAVYMDSPITAHDNYHDSHQIIFVVSGSIDYLVAQKHCHVPPGHAIIFGQMEQHAVLHFSEDYTRFVVNIRPLSASENVHQNKLYSVLSNRPIGFSHVLDLTAVQPQTHNIFRQIVAEFPSAAEYRNVMLNSLLQQLLVLIYRCEPLSFSPVHEDLFNVVSRIQHQFESQYHKTYNISDLARENSLSASYLSHIFKEISGTSVMNYLQSCRIAAAKKYLAETTLPINEIVDCCGFSDPSNFSRTFRRVVGCSPSVFRQTYNTIGKLAATSEQFE